VRPASFSPACTHSIDSARIDGGGLRPFRNADALAFQVLRRLHRPLAVDDEGLEAEAAGEEDRQADDVGVGLRRLRDEFGEGKLRHLPFAAGGEAREDLVDAHAEIGEVDALGLDEAEAQVANMVVIVGRDGQAQLGGHVAAFN
jgi:hypothetical protein